MGRAQQTPRAAAQDAVQGDSTVADAPVVDVRLAEATSADAGAAATDTTAWFVYVVECADGSLYTGIAKDVAARLAQHNDGQGARYTRGRAPVRLLHVEEAVDRGAALRREHAIKRLPARAKRALPRMSAPK